MKNKLILFVLLTTCFAMRAQTIHVSGDQTGVWDADTVLVTGDVVVGDSLTVLPGTVVLFDDFCGITVRGGASFKALGTETDSIVFTVADTTHFSDYDHGKGGWSGICFDKAGDVMLDYCVLQYGKATDKVDWRGGALKFVCCNDVKILHSTLRCNFAHECGGAIYAVDSQVQMLACAINENRVYDENNMYLYGGGACFLKSDVELREMEFRGNDSYCIGGALSIDSCSVVLDRAVFVDNVGVNGAGLYLMRSNHKKCMFSNLLFDNNRSHHFGGGLAISNASPEINNILVINNVSEGVNCCGIFFFEESSPIIYNSIVYGNYPEVELGHYEDTTQMWVWTFEGFAPEFRNCLIEGGTNYIHSADQIVVFENILDTDPLFVDAVHHDFRLSEESPCRDAGSELTPSYVMEGLDLAGLPRVLNNRIDIGPYEYSGASVAQHRAAPFAKLVGNPLHAQSRIEFDDAVKGEVTVTLYALTGRCVAQRVLNLEGTRSMGLGDLMEGLAPGVYLIEIKGENGVCSLKAVR